MNQPIAERGSPERDPWAFGFSKGAGLELTFIANLAEEESLDASIGEPACRKQGR
jgi:hypothetical protein